MADFCDLVRDSSTAVFRSVVEIDLDLQSVTATSDCAPEKLASVFASFSIVFLSLCLGESVLVFSLAQVVVSFLLKQEKSRFSLLSLPCCRLRSPAS